MNRVCNSLNKYYLSETCWTLSFELFVSYFSQLEINEEMRYLCILCLETCKVHTLCLFVYLERKSYLRIICVAKDWGRSAPGGTFNGLAPLGSAVCNMCFFLWGP